MSTQPDGVAADVATAAVSTVVEYIFEQYPHVARRAGRHEFDGRLPDVSPRSTTDLDRMRATVKSQLGALGESADPELRADLDAALTVLDGERFRAAELGQVHLGPVDRLEETDVSVYLRSPYAPLAERLAAMDTHLRALPQFLRQAARTLPARLPAGERLSGVEQARAQAINIGNVARQLALEHPELAVPRLTTATATAAAACEDFARAVEATEPAKALFGPDLLAAFLRATEGASHPVTDLLEEARAEVDSVISALDSAAAKLGVENRQRACELLTERVSGGSMLESFSSAMRRVKDFWIQQDIVSVETVTPLEVRGASQLDGTARVEFGNSPPLEQVRQPHILYVPEPPHSDVPGRASIRREYLNDPMLEVLALHEAFAGHYVQVEAALRGPSVIRTCVPGFPGFTEGWAHYVEELAVEHGVARGRPLVEVAQLKSALEAATRLLIFLSVHMGRWTFTEARDRAVLLCNWSPERAAREVLIVVSDSRGAMYTLGKLHIREWRTAGVGKTRRELKSFHDRLTQCGNAPLSTAWRYYLDGQRLSQVAPAPAYSRSPS